MDKSKLIKRILFGGILVAISLPMLLTFYPVIEFEPLDGYFEEHQKPEFSWDSVYSGAYQKNMEAFMNDKTAGKPYMVRINNQLDYWVFNKANVSSVLIGRNGYLLEQNYIDAYYGDDFIGQANIEDKVRKLQRVSDTLRHKGVELIVVFAPGKVSYYPDAIPIDLRKDKKRTNHQAYKDLLESTDVHFIDFKTWILEQKKNTKYPFFPKNGIHWSSYSEVLTADSMIRYMNTITTDSKINEIYVEKINPSRYAYNMDEDIEESMNLLYNLEDGILGYPQFKPVEHNSERTTRVLTIADSYFWGMYHWGLATEYFGNGPFWYYNREIFPESFTKQTFVQDIVETSNEVEKNDVVLILFNEANLKDFAYDFIERLYEEYCENGRQIREERIEKLIESIRNTPKWLAKVKKEAKNDGVSLEEALRNNAVYMLIQEEKN
jgi:hypothetical protein